MGVTIRHGEMGPTEAATARATFRDDAPSSSPHRARTPAWTVSTTRPEAPGRVVLRWEETGSRPCPPHAPTPSCPSREGPRPAHAGWEDAASAALKAASGTLRDLRVAEVVAQDIHLAEDGGITYRTKLRVSFKYEPGA